MTRVILNQNLCASIKITSYSIDDSLVDCFAQSTSVCITFTGNVRRMVRFRTSQIIRTILLRSVFIYAELDPDCALCVIACFAQSCAG